MREEECSMGLEASRSVAERASNPHGNARFNRQCKKTRKGEPHSIWACYNRDHHGTDVNVYDLNWHVHPEFSIVTYYYRDGKGRIP